MSTPISNDGATDPVARFPSRAPTSLETEARRAGIEVTGLDIRRDITRRMTTLVIVVNVAILAILVTLVLNDAVLVAKHIILPTDRLINTNVVLRLIESGAAQVGLIGVIMTRGVFQGGPGNKRRSTGGSNPPHEERIEASGEDEASRPPTLVMIKGTGKAPRSKLPSKTVRKKRA
jgi:hypothetical protein